MPFVRKARWTFTNEGDKAVPLYDQIDCTLGDQHPPGVGRLHVLFRRENPTTLRRDFELLPKRSQKGRFVGPVIGVRNLHPDQWWGEGEIKVYLDGDADFLTICGTGSEDYVGLAWGCSRPPSHMASKPEVLELDVSDLQSQLEEIEAAMGAEIARPFRLLLQWAAFVLGVLRENGTLYCRDRCSPLVLRLQGHPPVTGTVYELEQRRCLECGASETPSRPEEAGAEKSCLMPCSQPPPTSHPPPQGLPPHLLRGLKILPACRKDTVCIT